MFTADYESLQTFPLILIDGGLHSKFGSDYWELNHTHRVRIQGQGKQLSHSDFHSLNITVNTSTPIQANPTSPLTVVTTIQSQFLYSFVAHTEPITSQTSSSMNNISFT